jgi:hypothetical protein
MPPCANSMRQTQTSTFQLKGLGADQVGARGKGGSGDTQGAHATRAHKGADAVVGGQVSGGHELLVDNIQGKKPGQRGNTKGRKRGKGGTNSQVLECTALASSILPCLYPLP